MGRGHGGTRGSSAGGGGGLGSAFNSRIGTTGNFQVMGANGRRNFSGGKNYEVYVQGNKGDGTLSFNSAAEGNAFISKLQKNGFSVFKGYGSSFNE